MSRLRISQLTNKYLNHEMISLHTDLPEFPEARITLLYTVLNHQSSAAEHKELLSIVSGLVQVGLDTHDMVENEVSGHKDSMASMRAKQLKVLAGDYFTARFYHLLSQAEQKDTTRRISEAVCEINQVKMNLYAKMKQMRLNAEEYLQYGSELKSTLFLSFTSFMNGLYERLWPELVERFSRCEVLLQELKKVEKQTSLEHSWGVWHVLHEGAEEDRKAMGVRHQDTRFIEAMLIKYQVAHKLGILLEQSTLQLQSLLQRVHSDKLIVELQPLIDPFIQAAGEGRVIALKELRTI